MSKKLEIQLEDGPVVIDPAEWPEIASASGDSWGHNGDYCRHAQALDVGELDRYTVGVRQHEDGRVLVYAERDGAPAWTGNWDAFGGEVLDAAHAAYRANVVGAIRRACEVAEIPARIVREAIADLPAEEI